MQMYTYPPMNSNGALEKLIKLQEKTVELLSELNENVSELMFQREMERSIQIVNGNELASQMDYDYEVSDVCDCDDCRLPQQELSSTPAKPTIDEIERQAREDIINLSYSRQLLVYSWVVRDFVHHYTPEMAESVKIVVNTSKRTCAAFLLEEDGSVIYRGVSKCHPDDIFLPNVGVAIAVRRMFGLPVPEMYIQDAQ